MYNIWYVYIYSNLTCCLLLQYHGNGGCNSMHHQHTHNNSANRYYQSTAVSNPQPEPQKPQRPQTTTKPQQPHVFLQLLNLIGNSKMSWHHPTVLTLPNLSSAACQQQQPFCSQVNTRGNAGSHILSCFLMLSYILLVFFVCLYFGLFLCVYLFPPLLI